MMQKLTKTSVPSSGDHEINTILFLYNRQLWPPVISSSMVRVPRSLATGKLPLEIIDGISWAFAFLALVARLRVQQLVSKLFPVVV